MENWIQHVANPKKLYLAWQAPENFNERFRWIVAELLPDPAGLSLRYVDDPEEFKRLNSGKTIERIRELGYAGYPAFNQKRSLHTEGVVDALLRRLPPRSRPDFDAYKKLFRLAPDLVLSDIALLAMTEAKLPSDGFSVVNPFDTEGANLDLMLEIAGYRHYASTLSSPPRVGDRVVIVDEPENSYDENAVMVTRGGEKIGNINRLQAKAFRSWLNERQVEAVIERLNGRPDHPRAFVFVKVRLVANQFAA
ncbi:hypothetical protein AA13595_0885 [Gluconacetobacter johannae DSM 13595]|uniref:HIRAN domain-containing protein n=1 Tax=Gluconacetobacter johannae TaxID=112140 RepID=A0A7W4P496_9PROT|nr:HIRAN domain-containing protein [Gluconacetobacter johannae]MBB2177026.1 hypothetical protein [Gluconacetobacter johannae]GBQ82298.1 hypothetical protein AA13595_0885 [Gluconacetobacter johannae DSM 13595]